MARKSLKLSSSDERHSDGLQSLFDDGLSLCSKRLNARAAVKAVDNRKQRSVLD